MEIIKRGTKRIKPDYSEGYHKIKCHKCGSKLLVTKSDKIGTGEIGEPVFRCPVCGNEIYKFLTRWNKARIHATIRN